MREETLFQKTRSNLFTLFLARKIGTALRLGSSFDEPQSYAFLMVIPAIQSWRRRRSAVRSERAGAGTTFNLVAPRLYQYRRSVVYLVRSGTEPGDGRDGADVRRISRRGRNMTGQLLFADAGFECRQRGEHAW